MSSATPNSVTTIIGLGFIIEVIFFNIIGSVTSEITLGISFKICEDLKGDIWATQDVFQGVKEPTWNKSKRTITTKNNKDPLKISNLQFCHTIIGNHFKVTI